MPIQPRQQDYYSEIDFIIETELSQIRAYILGQEENLRQEQIRTREWIDKELWTDKSEPMPTMVIDIITQLQIFTPNLFFKSSLTLLYSFFESTFTTLTKLERDKRKIKLKINDLKGTGIQRSKDYFIKVIGIDFSPIDKFWEEIDKSRLLRNYVVHNESDSEDNGKQKKIKEICEENPYLSYQDNNDINILSSRYLTDFSEHIEDILNGLLNILRQ